MGLGPIPYTAVTNYLDENCVFGWEDREDFRFFIRILDNEYLSAQSEEREVEKQRKKSQKSSPKAPRRRR